MTPWRRRARRMRRVLVYGIAALVILAGLLVGLASQLLPLVQRHPQQVAQWLSERSGQPVAVRFGAAEWTRRGPLFALEGLTVGSGAGALDIGRAELLVDVYAGLLPGRPMTELRLRRIDVRLHRDEHGRWLVAGLGAAALGNQRLRQLEALGEVRLENARVTVSDARSGRSLSLDRVDARVRSSAGVVRIGARARRGDGAVLSMAAELDERLANGRAWLGGRGVALADWTAGLDLAGVGLHAGQGDLDIWATLSERRVVALQAEARLAGVTLRGIAPVALDEAGDSLSVEPRLGLDRVELTARWQHTSGGWRLEVPHLLLDDGSGGGRAESLLVVRNGHLQVQAGRLELGTPLAIAMLGTRLPPPARRWLYLAAPRGVLEDLRVRCETSGGCSGHTRFADLHWRPAGKVPGVAGLRGRVDGDGQAVLVDIQDAPVRVDAPLLWRAPIAARLDGRLHLLSVEPGAQAQPGLASAGIAADAAGAGAAVAAAAAAGPGAAGSDTAAAWLVGTDALQVTGEDFAASTSGSILLQGDGTRPLVDLFVDIAAAPLSAAKQFWVPRHMSPRLRAWLDRALVEGRISGAQAVLRGDLDDWPFRDGEGSFVVEAGLQDLVLDYRPGEWPRGEGLDGHLRFADGGMQGIASGTVGGVAVHEVDASIASFREPVLDLSITGAGSGAALFSLLRHSPLERRFGSHLLGVSVGGSADVAVQIRVPLKKELGPPSVQGSATLADADLADAKWGLAFEDASGQVKFGDGGFAAEALQGRFEGQPATLGLAIGDYAPDDLAAAASLQGELDIDALLRQAPTLDWLQPWMEGTSDWSIQLTVPRAGTGAMRRLQARSDLVGTRLLLPAPLRKGPAVALPAELDVSLPLQAGGVALRLGRLLSLDVRPGADGALAGTVAFGEVEVPPAPEQGLHVVGTVPALDLAGWAGVALSGTGSGDARLLAAVDIEAGVLDILGRQFPDARLQVDTSATETHIDLDGPALAGRISIPAGDPRGRGITARFDRLFWPDADQPTAIPAPVGFDPAHIPSLHVWVGDLRLGAARLGETRLETFPTPTGLHVQALESRSPDLELRASGDWGQVDGRERSRFQISFTSEDLGRMLAALGFAEVVQGGQALAQLEATWPGHPAAFDLGLVDGRLELDIGQGTIPDLEPGAGRILGLLSLSQIPRRLALDFSDFFAEGFSFNSIRGTFVLDGGSAYTEDLVIDSAAAEIRVRGRTGLADRTYAQTMEVLPRTSGLLPVVGALAAGPAGAAIGAVAQAVLQRPMKQMTRAVYRVGGSWDEPDIELIERGPRGPASGPP